MFISYGLPLYSLLLRSRLAKNREDVDRLCQEKRVKISNFINDDPRIWVREFELVTIEFDDGIAEVRFQRKFDPDKGERRPVVEVLSDSRGEGWQKITMLDDEGEILSRCFATWEREKDELKIELKNAEFDLFLHKSPGRIRLRTKDEVELKLDLYMDQAKPGKALLVTPFGQLDSTAGLLDYQQDENRVYLAYWIGDDDPENIQSFTLERSHDD